MYRYTLLVSKNKIMHRISLILLLANLHNITWISEHIISLLFNRKLSASTTALLIFMIFIINKEDFYGVWNLMDCNESSVSTFVCYSVFKESNLSHILYPYFSNACSRSEVSGSNPVAKQNAVWTLSDQYLTIAQKFNETTFVSKPGLSAWHAKLLWVHGSKCLPPIWVQRLETHHFVFATKDVVSKKTGTNGGLYFCWRWIELI